MTSNEILQSLSCLAHGAWITLHISFVAITFGFLGGLVLGVLSCQQLASQTFQTCVNGFVWLMRGIPIFMQVLLFYYVVPEALHLSFSPFVAGVLALSLNSMAYMSEIIRGGMDSIHPGQWEAAYVLGLPLVKTLKGIIFPQLFRITTPALINEITALVKQSSVLMIIGVGELTKVSKDIVARELNPVSTYLLAAGFYLLMTCVFASLIKHIYRRVVV